MKYITAILLLPLFANAGAECSREWALDKQMKSKNYVYGLGISAQADTVKAQAEAKQNAYKDVAQQLQSNVNSQSTINETENGSTYAGKIDLSSDMKALTGIKNVKEGKNPEGKITHCSVVKFDAGSAYEEYEGKMKVLEKSISEAVMAAKQKKYVEVLKKRIAAKKIIAANTDEIARADLFRTYLRAEDQSWFAKIKSSEVEMDQVAEKAKEQIVFIMPEGTGYDGSLGEVESKLSGSGFDVQKQSVPGKAVQLKFEIKPIGAPRKTKTALGITYVSKIMVSLKEGSKTIATNKGANVTGTGQNEDDALANIDRQLLVHLMDVLNEGLPGLIVEE